MELTKLNPLDKFISLLTSGTIAESADGKIKLYKSSGRRKVGRKTKYGIIGLDKPIHFTASNDNEAIIKANKRLSTWN